MAYFLVQFPSGCYVVHKSVDETYHIFYPHGLPPGKKSGETTDEEDEEEGGSGGGTVAGWLRCKDLKVSIE